MHGTPRTAKLHKLLVSTNLHCSKISVAMEHLELLNYSHIIDYATTYLHNNSDPLSTKE